MEKDISEKIEEIAENIEINVEGEEFDDLIHTESQSTQPIETTEGKSEIVSSPVLLGLYEEILNNLRDDRKEIDGVLANFIDMVMNGGEADDSSKEAVVKLLEVKTNTADKMAKIADLMTRIVLKERDTFPRYMAVHKENTININTNKRKLLEEFQKHREKE